LFVCIPGLKSDGHAFLKAAVEQGAVAGLVERTDGLDTLKAQAAAIRGTTLPFTEPRYDMINPVVNLAGDIAVLTFNLVSHGAQLDGGPKTTVRWNATEVYQRFNGSWKIIHSHWSYVTPVLKEGAE
jgi:ketosteroid isomerase-like protein